MLFRPARLISWLVIATCAACFFTSDVRAQEEPAGTKVAAGSSVDLFKVWPQIAKAPKSDLATLECLIRPDAAAIGRARAFLVILSNPGGSDILSISVTLERGSVRANVLGTKLKCEVKLPPEKWSHVALTVNTRTINTVSQLWINGELVDEDLVLAYWPKSFAVAEMLSDRWNQGREFSGQLGDVRFSRSVRYAKPFAPPSQLPKDDQTVIRIDGGKVPIGK